MTKLVDIGEGRMIELVRVAETPPTPAVPKKPKIVKKARKKSAPKPKTRVKKYKQTLYCKKQLIVGHTITHRPEVATAKKKAEVPGFKEWTSARIKECHVFRGVPGFPNWSRLGTPDGMNKKEAKKAWAAARIQVKKDMAALEKAGLLSDDEIAKEATEATLECMRGPMNQEMKLRAARQLLEWYKSKPVSKTETTLNAADMWLTQIAEGDTPKE